MRACYKLKILTLILRDTLKLKSKIDFELKKVLISEY